MNVVKCFDHELCDLHHRQGHFLHSVKQHGLLKTITEIITEC